MTPLEVAQARPAARFGKLIRRAKLGAVGEPLRQNRNSIFHSRHALRARLGLVGALSGGSRPGPSRPARRALIVDDDASVQRVLTVALELEQWEVRAVPDNEQAIALLEGGSRFELVISAIGGLDVLREAARSMPAARLVLHASAEDARAAEAAAIGVEILKKPVTARALRQLLTKAPPPRKP